MQLKANTGPLFEAGDSMYKDYIKSMNLYAPKLADFNLTEKIIEYIENPELLEADDKKLREKRIAEEKHEYEDLFLFIEAFLGFLITFAVLLVIIYKQCYSFLISIIASFLISIGIGWLLVGCLIAAVDLFIFRLKFQDKFVSKRLNKFISGLNISNLPENSIENYDAYDKAIEDYNIAIRNLKIKASWNDVRFKDKKVIIFVSIFNTTFEWDFDKSVPAFNDKKFLLINKMPEIFIFYKDGKLYVDSDFFDSAFMTIIEYVFIKILDDEAEKRKKEQIEKEKEQEKERKEKERKEKEEKERQEREAKEEEDRERELKEREKMMNDFISSHPYFKSEHDTQDELRKKIKVKKSKYLDYLTEHQLPGIDIMSVNENRKTASMMDWQMADIERGYIFIILMNADSYCLIYENVNEDNASLKYINSSLPACLEAAMDIKLHLQSKAPNKRDKIASTRRIGEHRVRRIKHDYFNDWKQKVHSRTFR